MEEQLAVLDLFKLIVELVHAVPGPVSFMRETFWDSKNQRELEKKHHRVANCQRPGSQGIVNSNLNVSTTSIYTDSINACWRRISHRM